MKQPANDTAELHLPAHPCQPAYRGCRKGKSGLFFGSEKPLEAGIPSVAYFASHLHLSPNYFGDLVKKEEGKTALEYIQAKLIAVAKEKIFDVSKSVSEIAYELGCKYPQHFTTFFKQQVGSSPNEYRSSLN